MALDQFKERADRDGAGAALVILSAHAMRILGDLGFGRLNALAEPRDIPVIDQYDHILLEWLKRNQDVCTVWKRS